MPEGAWRRLGAVLLLLYALPAAAMPVCDGMEIGWTAWGQNFDPSQTHAPGAPPRPVSDDRVRVRWWPAEARAELDWRVQTHYPFPAEYHYRETLRADGGSIEGADSFRPDPEGRIRPGRRAARFTDLWLRVPLLWPGMEAGSSREITLGGGRWMLSVAREPGAPLIATAREYDPPRGDVAHEVRYSRWTEVAGLSMPTRVERRLEGQLVRRERIEALSLQPGGSGRDGNCEAAGRQPREAVPPQWARGMTLWLLRRIAMGAGADFDQTRNIELVPVGEGLHHVVGGSHHALLVEGNDGLSLIGAPLYPARSERLLRLIAERWPEKPLREVVLTHHHNDHSGGLVPLLETGAVLSVGAAGEAFFRDVLRRHGLDTISLRAVHGSQRIRAGGRELRLIPVPSSHAAGMLAVRVEDAAMTFVSDVYSPGRSTQNPQLVAELLAALHWVGAADGRLVGAHGTGTESVAAMAEWLRQQLPDWRLEPAAGDDGDVGGAAGSASSASSADGAGSADAPGP